MKFLLLKALARLTIKAISKDVAEEFADKYPNPKQSDLVDFVKEKGFDKEEISELMYDLHGLNFKTLTPPEPSVDVKEDKGESEDSDEKFAERLVEKYTTPSQEDLNGFAEEEGLDASQISELMYDLQQQGVVNLSAPPVAQQKWYHKAKKELEKELNVETEMTIDDENTEIRLEAGGAGDNGESEWVVYVDSETAEQAAIDYVTEMIDDEPGTFSQDFLKQHYYISTTDRRLIALEDTDDYWDAQDDSDVEEEADRRGIDYDDAADALEKVKDEISTEKEEQMEKDPLGYFEEIFGDDISQYPKNLLQIDTKEAAEDAVRTDGVAHFLDNYDNEEIDLPSGAVAFGTN